MSAAEAIFTCREDYVSWEKHIEHAERHKSLSPVERRGAARAFALLRTEFGADFLATGWEDGHPFLTDLSYLGLPWLTWLGEAVDEAKSADGYADLLRRLRAPHRFREAISVLDAADRLRRSGFECTYDPAVVVGGRPKKPDLRVVHRENGEEIFAEVSIQQDADAQREAQETHFRILKALRPGAPFVHHAGEIGALAKVHLEQLLGEVSAKVARAQSTGSFQSIEIPDVVTLGLDVDQERLEAWAAERGLHVGHCPGPRFSVNDAHRTRLKIDKEQRQLPRDRPGMLVINSDWMFIGASDPGGLIRDIEEEMYRLPHLQVVVVTGAFVGEATEATSTRYGQHVHVRRVRHGRLFEQSILLFNEFCEHRLLPRTINAIYSAFGQHGASDGSPHGLRVAQDEVVPELRLREGPPGGGGV